MELIGIFFIVHYFSRKSQSTVRKVWFSYVVELCWKKNYHITHFNERIFNIIHFNIKYILLAKRYVSHVISWRMPTDVLQSAFFVTNCPFTIEYTAKKTVQRNWLTQSTDTSINTIDDTKNRSSRKVWNLVLLNVAVKDRQKFQSKISVSSFSQFKIKNIILENSFKDQLSSGAIRITQNWNLVCWKRHGPRPKSLFKILI